MSADKSANRSHCLSKPPPVRELAVAPNGGCMPCVDRAGDECPYRAAFGCTDADKADGILIGRCVFEAARRQAILDDYEPLLEYVPEEQKKDFAYAVVRLIDALLYSARASLNRGITFNRAIAEGRDPFGSPEAKAAERYADAGTNRMLRTLGVLQPLVAEARRV
jgi:hypothetical protein